MPNLISQMRNAPAPPQQQIPPAQLNNSVIWQVKSMMNAMRQSNNPQEYLLQIMGQNPALMKAVQQGNLQAIAQQMANERGIDLNSLVRQLEG